MKQESLIN